MPIPNGGLITETNAQYYAGAQQKYTSAGGINETITSTFDTNLVVGTGNYADPATNGYNLNNFKIYTSPDANTWTELTPDATNQTATATGNGGVASVNIQLAAANANIIAGMTIYGATITGNPTGAKVVSMNQGTFVVTLDTAIAIPGAAATNAVNFKFDQPWSMLTPNVITIAASLAATSYFKIQLNDDTLWDTHGSYEYTRLYDIIDNFLIAYVGVGKLIPSIKRTDVIFHAKRAIQEFSYDITRVEKIFEQDIPSTLVVPMPQDYVNYVKLSWVDDNGLERRIYPTSETSRPSKAALQDTDAAYLYDNDNSLLLSDNSTTIDNFEGIETNAALGSSSADDYFAQNPTYSDSIIGYGRRYGSLPEQLQVNGVFVHDEVNGQFGFSSNLSGKTLTLHYVSDGLGTDAEMQVHKLAEEAIYKHIAHAILASKANVPEYIVNRFRRERRATMRNAKLRLSNIKLSEITQVMRGKSKHLKH